MRVAHVLRKYNPDEWGGTETAVKRLLDGLRAHNVESIVFCPKIQHEPSKDPFLESGYAIKKFSACVPVWGISEEQRNQLIAVGGNILSFDVIWSLYEEPDLSIVHTHTGNRLGGIALTVARLRKLPLVVTVHGGAMDLPQQAREYLMKPLEGGVEWGKLFGWPLRSRRVLQDADAILTCNVREAELLKEKYPDKRVVTQPHGVPFAEYQKDCRRIALNSYPELQGKDILLTVGRLDPVKNQGWLIAQAERIFQKFPNAALVFAGAGTDPVYEGKLKEAAAKVNGAILFTGGIAPGDPRLLGLFQEAAFVIVPSLSETFGLVIIEAWAAGTAVISSRTSGALGMLKHKENGWLFDLEKPDEFHICVSEALASVAVRESYAARGKELVREQYDTTVLAGHVKQLYSELIEQKR